MLPAGSSIGLDSGGVKCAKKLENIAWFSSLGTSIFPLLF